MQTKRKILRPFIIKGAGEHAEEYLFSTHAEKAMDAWTQPAVDALELAEMELKAMYQRLGFKGSNVLDKIQEALKQYNQ